MIPYITFCLLLFFLYRSKSPMWMIFLLILFSALRYDTGWDYKSYYDACTDPITLSVAQKAWGQFWGWWFGLMYKYNMPFVGIGIPAILTQISIALALYILLDNNKKKISEALLIYGLWPFLYLFSFCIIRQFFAIGVSLLAFALFYKKRYLFSVALYLFAFILHPSSFVSVLFPMALLRKTRLNTLLIVAICIIIAATFGSLSIYLASMNMQGYADLLESDDSFGGKVVYVYMLLSLFLLMAIAKNKDVISLESKMLSLLAIAVIIQFIVYVAPIPSIISRAILYSMIFLPIGLPYSIEKLGLASLKNVIYLLLMMFFLVYLVVTENSEGAASQYVPYKIFLDL